MDFHQFNLRCCLSTVTLLLVVLRAPCSSSASGSSAATQSSEPLSCYSCLYYSKIPVPINNKACISGESVNTAQCPPETACKVTFLQDSIGSIVHASRSCQQSALLRSGRGRSASAILNARTTMYCRQYGCNNNWNGAPALGHLGQSGWSAASSQSDDAKQLLHCWVGYGRHIDQFKLLPCSQKILRLTRGNNRSSSGQIPVCLLAQLTRQIKYNGSTFESATYMADCAPHASSVYGQNYPMFEYERVCKEPGCNSGGAVEKLSVGLLTLAARSDTPGAAATVSSIFVAALVVTVATAIVTLH